MPVADQVRAVMEESGLLDALRNEHTIEAEGRLENLQEFLGVAQEFDRNDPPGSLSDFLEEISLFTDLDALRDSQPLVTLMTLHNAKGLEFPVVFIVGMEDGVFPHSRALDEQNIEEERRLCYVGITRAEQRLFLSYAQQRSLYGVGSANLPSRFLAEIPAHLVEARRSSTLVGAGSDPATRWGRGSRRLPRRRDRGCIVWAAARRPEAARRPRHRARGGRLLGRRPGGARQVRRRGSCSVSRRAASCASSSATWASRRTC